jgi:hypothetical protein
LTLSDAEMNEPHSDVDLGLLSSSHARTWPRPRQMRRHNAREMEERRDA